MTTYTNRMLIFRGQISSQADKFPQTLRALSLAEQYHEGQFRKSGEPYLDHPIAVASLLYATGVRDDTILAAALLHDTLEDTKIKPTDFNEQFGQGQDLSGSVLYAVTMLSKNLYDDNDEYYNNFWQGSDLIGRRAAIMVKIADRAHNLLTMGAFSVEKKIKYIKETQEYSYPLLKKAMHTYYEFGDSLYVFWNIYNGILDNLKFLVEESNNEEK